jgi:hypothetical protein
MEDEAMFEQDMELFFAALEAQPMDLQKEFWSKVKDEEM